MRARQSSIWAAPPTQAAHSDASHTMCSANGRWATMSHSASRPPGGEVHDTVGQDQVDGSWRHGRVLDVSGQELGGGGRAQALGFGQLGFAHVDAGHVSGRADEVRGGEHVGARAAAQVQHALAGCRAGQVEAVADAGEGLHRLGGHVVEQVGRVAQAFGQGAADLEVVALVRMFGDRPVDLLDPAFEVRDVQRGHHDVLLPAGTPTQEDAVAGEGIAERNKTSAVTSGGLAGADDHARAHGVLPLGGDRAAHQVQDVGVEQRVERDVVDAGPRRSTCGRGRSPPCRRWASPGVTAGRCGPGRATRWSGSPAATHRRRPGRATTRRPGTPAAGTPAPGPRPGPGTAAAPARGGRAAPRGQGARTSPCPVSRLRSCRP